jgi:hypothetical protein
MYLEGLEIQCLNSSKFEEKVKLLFPLNEIKWIQPNTLFESTPENYLWTCEGTGGFLESLKSQYNGIATTGLLTCTGVSAFTQDGCPAFAHISDMCAPKKVLQFLTSIKVDTNKPVTLISSSLNENHLLKVKWVIEENYENITPTIITPPIIFYKKLFITSLIESDLREYLGDHRGISVTFNKEGKHTFFKQSFTEQTKITDSIKENISDSLNFTKLYVSCLPFKKKEDNFENSL